MTKDQGDGRRRTEGEKIRRSEIRKEKREIRKEKRGEDRRQMTDDG
jgi:hypothetical protein